MKKVMLLLLFTALIFSKEYFNPNGRPGHITVGVGFLFLENQHINVIVPLNNYMTFKFRWQNWNAHKEYYLVNNFSDGHLSYVEIKEQMTGCYDCGEYMPGMEMELHLPLYKLWEK